jgi:uncharacterized repeat protein (TIGR03803 family)
VVRNKSWAMWLLMFWCVSSSAQTLKTLFIFDQTHGATPDGALAQGTDGALYGTTTVGGSHDDGVAFRVTTKGRFTVVQNFCPPANCTNGAWPRAGMLLGTDGSLYGTTEFDSFNFGNGTIYKITPEGTLTTVHQFEVTDGSGPQDALIESTDGAFYGTTAYGGAFGDGTVFRIMSPGTLGTIHSFNISDGSYPVAGLVQTNDGSFFGTTVKGGTGNCNGGCGTVFRITRNGTFSVVHSFNDFFDGQEPYGTLMQDSHGSLYGTTHSGGLGWGTVFKISRSGVLTTIRRLHSSDGGAPLGKLIQATDGNLYGTTSAGGGPAYSGTIFQIKPNGTFTTVHYFDGFDGATPTGLLQHTNGKFYGTTSSGGVESYGTIYELDMGLTPFVTFARASGHAGQSVSILGQGFTGTTDVSLNGVSISFTVMSDTHIIGKIPQGATSGYVTVTTPAGVFTSNVPFRALP